MIIPIDDCGSIGLIQDQYAQELVPNAWSRTRNFVFREGYAQKIAGHVPVYGTPSIPPYHITNVLTAAGVQWVYAGLEKIYAVDPDLVHTNITRQTVGVDVDYTGDESTKWSGGVLSGIVILNNGVDVPQAWPGTGRCVDLPNWPANTICKVLRPFRNYLVALNVTQDGTNFPHLIKWSNHAEPGTYPSTWDVTDTTADAGAYDLADDQSELIDGLGLGEQFIAYKRSGYYSVQYIGTPFIFRFQKLSDLYGGAFAQNCVATFPGGHFVLSPGNVYVHQGGPPESIIDAKNRRWLFKQLDASNQQRTFVMRSPLESELWICFPELGATFCTKALVWNWKYNTWGVRDLPNIVHGDAGSINFQQGNTWESLQNSWQSAGVSWMQNVSTLPIINAMMASPANSRLYSAELTSQFDGVSYESFVERDNIRFDEPGSVKLVKEVRPLIEGPVGSSIDVFVSAAYDQTADPTWYGPFPFRIGVDQKIDCHVVGRMMGVRFASSGDFPWRLKRYELVVDKIGAY